MTLDELEQGFLLTVSCQVTCLLLPTIDCLQQDTSTVLLKEILNHVEEL